MKTMDVASSIHFGGQVSASSLEHNDDLDDVLHEDHPDNNRVFCQNFNGYASNTVSHLCVGLTEF